mgnify:CR=1 FL=1
MVEEDAAFLLQRLHKTGASYDWLVEQQGGSWRAHGGAGGGGRGASPACAHHTQVRPQPAQSHRSHLPSTWLFPKACLNAGGACRVALWGQQTAGGLVSSCHGDAASSGRVCEQSARGSGGPLQWNTAGGGGDDGSGGWQLAAVCGNGLRGSARNLLLCELLGASRERLGHDRADRNKKAACPRPPLAVSHETRLPSFAHAALSIASQRAARQGGQQQRHQVHACSRWSPGGVGV